MVEHRCKELGVTEIHQGIMNKLDCLKGILEKYSSANQHYDLSNVAYIGDDLLDLQCMNPITEAGGISGCPSNAAKEVIAACSFVAPQKGGEGAVRDFAEYLLFVNNVKDNFTLEERCIEAAKYLSQLKGEGLSLGCHIVNDGFYYNVIEYKTTNEKDKPFENHRKYVDVQLLLDGEEIMQIIDVSRLQVIKEYNTETDVALYTTYNKAASIVLRPGSIMILHPRDAHRSMSFDNNTVNVKKIVGKVIINKAIKK